MEFIEVCEGNEVWGVDLDREQVSDFRVMALQIGEEFLVAWGLAGVDVDALADYVAEVAQIDGYELVESR